MSPGEESQPKSKQRLGRIIIDGKIYVKIEDVPEEFRERVRARLADLDEKPRRRSPGGAAAAKTGTAESPPARPRAGLIAGLVGALAAVGAATFYFLR